MMGIKLQGNICSCGKVWFSPDIPENEPNRCPFCNRKIEMDEILDDDGISQQLENDELPDDVHDNLDRASGNEEMDLVTKICKFCTNELYFDKKDAEFAKYCPYCDDFLIYDAELDKFHLNQLMEEDPRNMTVGSHPMDKPFPLDMFDEVNINELVKTPVLIKFKSCNPFNKPVECVFLGVDFITSQIKIENLDGSIEWRSLNSTIYVKTIKENDDESRISSKYNQGKNRWTLRRM